MERFRWLWVAALSVICVCPAAWAGSESHAGTFGRDDAVVLLPFLVTEDSRVIVRTFGYAGGTQADGTVIAPGGFDPVISLFTASGDFVGVSDDAEPPLVGIDPVTVDAFDAFLQTVLVPGGYTVALTQYSNVARLPSFSDGFEQAGQGNFTGPAFHCSHGRFCDFTGANRTGNWALDIVTAPLAPGVPEPAPAVWLSVLALLVLARRAR